MLVSNLINFSFFVSEKSLLIKRALLAVCNNVLILAKSVWCVLLAFSHKSVKCARSSLIQLEMLPLGESPIVSKEKLTKVTVVLFVLSIFTFAATIMPVVSAETSMGLTPMQGPAGTDVQVLGAGFTSSSQATITFGTTQVAKTSVQSMFGRVVAMFKVPSVSAGTYTVTITDATGNTASETFTVTSGVTPTPTPTSGQTSPVPTGVPTSPGATSAPWTTAFPTPTAPWWNPYATPNPLAGDNSLSPLVIGAIVASAVTAALLVGFFVYRSRSARDMFPEEESSTYRPEPSAPAYQPSGAPRYGQSPSYGQRHGSYSPYSQRYGQSPPRYTPTSRYGSSPVSSRPTVSSRMPSYTKTCPRCKRPVKDDYNMCPYCDKRLR